LTKKKALAQIADSAFFGIEKKGKISLTLPFLRGSGSECTESEEIRKEPAQKGCWQQIRGH